MGATTEKQQDNFLICQQIQEHCSHFSIKKFSFMKKSQCFLNHYQRRTSTAGRSATFDGGTEFSTTCFNLEVAELRSTQPPPCLTNTDTVEETLNVFLPHHHTICFYYHLPRVQPD